MSIEAKEPTKEQLEELVEVLGQQCKLMAERVSSRNSEHALWAVSLFDKIDASGRAAECCWKHLPCDVRTTLYSTPMAGINGVSDTKNDGFVQVLIFLRRVIDSILGDSAFDWNLWQATRSSYIIAADLLMSEDQTKAMLMVFCGAAFQECLACGAQFVDWVLKKCASMNVVDTQQGPAITFGRLFRLCAYVSHAVDHTRTPLAMANFLASFLTDYEDTKHLANRLADFREGASDSPIHSFIAHGPPIGVIKLPLILVDNGINPKFSDGSPTGYHEFEVYEFTLVRWIFTLCFSLNSGNMKGLLSGSWAVPTNIRAMIQFGASPTIYLAESGNKTLKDIGVEDDTTIINSFDMKAPEKAASKTKKKDRRKQRKASKRAAAVAQEHAPDQLSSEILREQHSRAMEPVLDELRPRLKAIRDKLASQSLVKTRPKERKSKKSSVDKENVSNSVAPMLPSSAGGKAGKTVYPVLVGEPANLYKTSRLCPRNRPRTITLDLHGCSRDEALKRLDKGLKEWVERAMKGQHPFIIPVDIVCGGGNQILSDLVAKFIRENAQIANRPRGLA